MCIATVLSICSAPMESPFNKIINPPGSTILRGMDVSKSFLPEVL